MFLPNRIVIVSNALRKTLIRRTCCVDKKSVDKESVDKKYKYENRNFDPGKLINISTSSVKEFVNKDKIDLLKGVYQPKNEYHCSYNFVICEDVAKDIVKRIITDEDQKRRVVVEGNPGLGLITINLIKSGIPRILVCDNSDLRDICLTQILERHPEKLILKRINMNKSPDSVLLDALDFGGKHDAPVTIIGAATNYHFLKGLIINTIKYKCWKKQHTEIFMILGDQVWKNVKGGNNRRSFKYHFHSLLHLLFDVKELEKYPPKAFLPLCRNSTCMHLVKLSVNPKACAIIKDSDLRGYYAFIKVIGRSKNNNVIQILENWVPDCGPYLISKGITITTRVDDLEPSELPRLYLLFKYCWRNTDLPPNILSEII